MTAPGKVALCLPSHGAPYREHEKCLAALRAVHPEWRAFELHGMPCIDVGRSSITESVLRWAGPDFSPDDMMLWLDADMTFSVETCEEILEAAREKQAIVGCLYAGKKFGGKPQAAFSPGTKDVVCFEGGGLIEIEAIGFGCVAMPVAMFEVVAQKLSLPALRVLDRTFRPWFTSDSSGAWESFHSDDYAFCRRAKACGFKVFADTRQRVGHVGYHTYFLEDAIPLPRFKSLTIHDAEADSADKAAE